MLYGIPQPFPNAVEDIIADAKERYPNEACGFIIDGEYVPKRNIADEPTKTFQIHKNAYLAAERKGGLDAVVHSHPDGDRCPTQLDMENQIASALPWGVVWLNGTGEILGPAWWGDTLDIPPLVGRPFVHGIYDCYSIIRDFYRLTQDITIPEYPRSWGWWTKPADVSDRSYNREFTEAGFIRIQEHQIQPGDVFLAIVQSEVTNHGGIYLGGNLILHHVVNKLSRRDPIGAWSKYVTHWLRYEKEIDRNFKLDA